MVQETIQHEQLEDDVGQRPEFTEEEPVGVVLILEAMLDEERDNCIDVLLFLLLLERGLLQLTDEGLHSTAFPVSPEPSRKIESDRLEEQEQRHPLVVGVLDHRFVLRDLPLVHTGRSDVVIEGAVERTRQGERAFDPTVLVQKPRLMAEFIIQAEYRIAEELRGTDEDTASEQQTGGEFVVKPEHSMIRLHCRKPDQGFDRIGPQQLVHLAEFVRSPAETHQWELVETECCFEWAVNPQER